MGFDRLLLFGMIAQIARQRKQFERRLEIDFLGHHPFEQARILGLLFFVVRIAALHVGSEPTDLDVDRLVRLGTNSQRLVTLFGLIQQMQRGFERHFVGSHVFFERCRPIALLDKGRVTTHSDVDLGTIRQACQ